MTLDEYQKAAIKTCMPSCFNDAYMLTNLVGEVGELASKVAKGIRKGHLNLSNNYLSGVGMDAIGNDYLEGMKAECGDILWQLSGFCKVMGWSLEEIAQGNLDKLASRKERGVIDGDGDNR